MEASDGLEGMQELFRDPKFAYLQQPIRDLAKNWNIDVARDLEEYLDKLAGVQVSFDGGKSSLNFTQAAMLLQGSACVYGKKVDYLYSLVSDVQGSLTRKKSQRGGRGRGSTADDGDDAGSDDQDESMLEELDDAIEEGRQLDMKYDTDETNQDICLAPISLTLVPLTEEDKHSDPLMSADGEVLGHMNDFKLNLAEVHPSGYLLTDPALAHLIGRDYQASEGDRISPAPQGELRGDGGKCPEIEDGNNINEGVDDGAADEFPWDENPGGADDDGSVCADGADAGGADPAVMSRNLRPRNNPSVAAQELSPVSEQIDPWLNENDPHFELPSKPFKRGNTTKVPAFLKPTGKRQRNADVHIAQKKDLPTIAEFLSSMKKPRQRKVCSKFGAFPVFESILQRRKEQEKKRKSQWKSRQNEPNDSDKSDNEEDDDQDIGADGGHGDDDDGGIRFFTAPDPFEGADDDDDGGEAGMNMTHTSGLLDVTRDYGMLVNKHVEEYLRSAVGVIGDSGMSDRVSQWTEKMEKRMGTEEQHPFDMRAYGTQILGSFEGGQEISLQFKDLVRGQSVQDVCRTFAATLQLANTGNITLKSSAMDQVTVTFQSDEHYYENLADGLPTDGDSPGPSSAVRGAAGNKSTDEVESSSSDVSSTFELGR